MSRIGKKEIIIPQGVTVTLTGQVVHVKGAKGELTYQVRPEIGIRDRFAEYKTDGSALLIGFTFNLRAFKNCSEIQLLAAPVSTNAKVTR
jgi:hypothetical protein